MPLDPLEHPLGVLTEHPILEAEIEAALITALRAGVEARAAVRSNLPPADPQLLRQIAQGDDARATLARHNLRLVVSIAKRYLRVAGPHLTLEDQLRLKMPHACHSERSEESERVAQDPSLCSG